jgi:hypothetical protein
MKRIPDIITEPKKQTHKGMSMIIYNPYPYHQKQT